MHRFIRHYSFAKELRSVLKSFEAEKVLPPTRLAISKFQKAIHDGTSTQRLIQKYHALQRASETTLLPHTAAGDLIKRLLGEHEVSLATDILLSYDLNDAVTIASSAVANDKSLEFLYRALLSRSQPALANQILVEYGWTRAQRQAFKELLTDRDIESRNIRDFEANARLLNAALHRGIDPYSIDLLIDRAIKLQELDYAANLVRTTGHGASRILPYLDADRAISVLLACSASHNLSLVVSKVKTLEQLKQIAQPSKDVALKALELGDATVATENLPVSYTERAQVIIKWPDRHRLPTIDEPLLIAVLEAITETIEGRHHLYPVEKLLQVLQATEQISFKTQQIVNLHFLHRPRQELLPLLELKIMSTRSIQGIINHHLRQRRGSHYELIDEQVYVDAIRARGRELYTQIITSLITTEPDLALKIIAQSEEQLGDMTSIVIRALTRLAHPSLLVIIQDHRAAMTYDIYARCICRLCVDDIEGAFSVYRLMSQDHTPKIRLLQNMSLRISANTKIPDQRAFHYLMWILKQLKIHKMPFDRIFLASLLKVVLQRQGIMRSPDRTEYLLKHLSRLSESSGEMQVHKQELLDTIHKWRLYERSRGTRESLDDQRRPRRLREIIELIGHRNSVMNPK